MKNLKLLSLLALVAVIVLALLPKEALAAFSPSRILNLYVLNKLLVGDGTESNAVTKVLQGSVTVDFDGGTLGCTTIAAGLAGVRQGDRCFLGSTTPYTANNVFLCNATDAGEVTVTNCHLGVASDPAAATYGFTVLSAQ